MKFFDFSGPAIMIIIITSYANTISIDNPGHRAIQTQEFTSYNTCKAAAELIVEDGPGSRDHGVITLIPGALNAHRQIIDVYCVEK